MNNFRRTKEVKEPTKKKSNAMRTALILFVLLMLVSTFTWAVMHRQDPQVAKVMAIRAQLEDQSVPREQKREIFGQMREEMDKLTPAQRESIWADRIKEHEEREKKELKEFFAMTKAEQIADIDKEIDRWKNRRGGRGERGPGGRDGGNGGGGRGGNGGGVRSQTFGRDSETGKSAANNRAKAYLDRSDPDTRAQRAERRRMVNERRSQRG